MSRFRKLHRQEGWTKVVIDSSEKAKAEVDHLYLLGWAQELCGIDNVQAIMRKNPSVDLMPLSIFAFKNPEDASMFILRWK